MKSRRLFILPFVLYFIQFVSAQKFDHKLFFLIQLDSLRSSGAITSVEHLSQLSEGTAFFHQSFPNDSRQTIGNISQQEPMVSLLVKTDGRKPAPSYKVISKHPGNVYHMMVPLNELRKLQQEEWLIRAESGEKLYPLNENGVTYTNGWLLQTNGYNGDSVLCGIIDTGIDFTHPAFRNPDGSTRILYLWDQTDDSTSSAHPQPYNYGREYTRQIIDQDLFSGSYHSIVNQRDLSGHGTMVAGTFAGKNYQLNPLTDRRLDGNAIHGNLIVVKTTFNPSAILDAVQYISDKANVLNLPLVIVFAGGNHSGPHDGSDNFTSTLASYTGPGRIIVQSAGNSGNDSIHVSGTINPRRNSSNIYFDVKQAISKIYTIQIYYSSSARCNITIVEADGTTIQVNYGQNPYFNSQKFSSGGGIYYVSNTTDAFSGDNLITILMNAPSAGRYYFRLRNTSRNNVCTFHSWIENGFDDNVVFESPTDSYFHGSVYTSTQYGYTLVNNACARDLIVVGGYLSRKFWRTQGQTPGYQWMWNDGDVGGIAPFSSHGPTRRDVQKPDISAAAGVILSTKSGDIVLPGNYPWGPDENYSNYNYYIGTSFSAAIVAGGIAQLLEKYPNWGPQDIIQYFQYHSQPSQGNPNAGLKTDPGTWDPAFGYGVLDLTAEANYFPYQSNQFVSGTQDIYVGTKLTSTVTIHDFQADSFKIDLYTQATPPFLPPGSKVLPRFYVIEPKPVTGYVRSDLTLYYTDEEFQSAGFVSSRESDLALYRYHNGAWIYMGGLVDTVNNSITVYDVTQYSIWAIGSMQESSLPVDIVSIEAVRSEEGNVIRWQTRAEFDVLGYEIYRSENENGTYALVSSYRINENLKSKGNSNLGHQYEYLDRAADFDKTYWYKILAVNIDGSMEEFPPVQLSELDLGVDVVDASIPQEFKLNPPYPNPFNPETSIEFSIRKIPRQMFVPVFIAVYNMLGQRVDTIYEGNLPPGTYRITWDASKLPSGVYIIHLLTPYWQKYQRAVLVK